MKICTKCAPDSCSDSVAHVVFMTPAKGQHTKGRRKYQAYFVLRDGKKMFGLLCDSETEAWLDYASIIHDPDIEWVRGMDPFKESGIAVLRG